jgi:secondary thiamine-phosphate synthase enzyme
MAGQPLRYDHPEPSLSFFHDDVELETDQHTQFVDVTSLVERQVRRSGVTHGLVNVQTRHTTTAVVVNENEPLLIEDLKRHLENWAPRDAVYRHNDLAARGLDHLPCERLNGHSHHRAIILGSSETLNVVDGRIRLGEWQRIFLVEMDGCQRRKLSITVIGLGS